MSSGDSNLASILMEQFDEVMSDDVKELMQQFSNLEALEQASSFQGKKKRKEIDRKRNEGYARLWNDYFAPRLVYDGSFFRRRFRMTIRLFNQIVDGISEPGNSDSENFNLFTQRYDDVGRNGLSPRQKATCAIRQLAYGASADQCDEYIRIGESFAIEFLRKFYRSIVEVYSAEYLRGPTQDDINRILPYHQEKHGFPQNDWNN